MAYQAFASYYDRLIKNEVDYRARARYFDALIRRYADTPQQNLLLDLACGTGSLSVELSAIGYDVIGVDASAEMLAEAAAKGRGKILFLCQAFDTLDLYGTVGAVVCALDSLNHITDAAALEAAFARVALFTAPGGVFVFDVNTPYKHREILADNTFVYDLGDLFCVWQNTTDASLQTEIALDFFLRSGACYTRESERFCERAYTHETLAKLLDQAGFDLCAVCEGDIFDPPGETAQRAVYIAKRRCGRAAAVN